MKVLIYHNWIPKVGGIETAVYNLAKALDQEGYEVTIGFRGYQVWDSLLKYAQVANVVNLKNQKIKTDVCLIASNHQRPKEVEAKKWLQWVHSDYDRYKLRLVNKDLYDKKKLQFIAVSEHAKKVIERREGIKNTEVIYNLIDEDFGSDKKKPLKLVTASRISPEKGFGRMLQLAQKLKEEGVKFNWVVYGDNMAYPREEEQWKRKFRDIEEVYFVGYKSDITPGLQEADYLVQLSDFEGCPLSILEALKLEIPCIVTDWNGVDEIIEQGENGWILPMSMNINKTHIDKIVKKKPKFEHKPKSTVKEWDKILKKE